MENLIEYLLRIENRLERIESVLETQSLNIEKEWYSVSEAAELLKKATFTVREWCRLDRINARKRHSGRGLKSEWMISKTEIERISNHGLLPKAIY